MFTGIIEAVGRIERVERRGDGARLEVLAEWSDGDLPGVALGESVAVNGTCLTVVDFAVDDGSVKLVFDASHETLGCTTLGDLKAESRCNLERALRVGDRLGGHLVSGHVDATATLVHVDDREGAWDLHYALPASLESEVVEKGSVALDGVSLTINRVWDGHFSVTVVPHTRDHTQLLDGGLGRAVNIETDLLAKYVRRSLSRMEAGGGEPTG